MGDPLSIPGSIVAVLQLSSKVVYCLNSVANAPKERENVFREISSLTGLLFLIKDQAERGYKGGVPSNHVRSLNVPGGPLEQLKTTLETLASKFSPVGALRKIEKVLSWPFDKAEIYGVLQAMERLKAFFMLALQMDHSELSQEIKSSIDDLSGAVQGLRLHQNEEECRRILDWLATSDMDQKQQDVFSLHQDGTCAWFLQSGEFLNWLDKDRVDPLLWCSGNPGVGKTVVTSVAVDHLQNHYHDEGVGIAFAYCRYNDPEANTSQSIIASLARQLAMRDDVLHREVDQLYRKLTRNKKPKAPGIKELQNLILILASSFDTAYILVDGIDECEKKDRSWLLSSLNSLVKLKNGQVRVLATSRPHAQDIALAFKSSVQLEIRPAPSDIEAFVRSQLDEDFLERINADGKENDELMGSIMSSTAKQTSGMFLMAVLQMDRIRDADNVKEIKDALASMPSGLFAMYAESLERMAKQPETRYRRGLRILAWISRATRPLLVNELLHALVVEDVDNNTPPKQLDHSSLVQPKVLLDVCAGLVVIDPKSNIIRLVHATAQEYLDQLDGDQFHLADENISRACLNYLSFDEFSKGPSASDNELEQRLRDFPFLQYSTRFWGHHLQRAGNGRLQEMALALLRHEMSTMSMNQISHLARLKAPGYSQLYPKLVNPLHISAHLGLRELAQFLIADDSVNVNSADSFGWTALHRAAENGHLEILRLLLEASCNVNISSRYGGTALHRAAKNGHVGIARLLLDSEAQVDAEDNYGGTPLHRAARGGHEATAKLLLQRGADVHRTYNFEVTLRLMMEKGLIESHVVSDTFQVLAHSAAKDEAALRIEAELTERERLKGGTALHEAAGAGSEALVHLLLNQGKAEVDVLDNFRGSALHRASSHGHEPIITLLLEKGASINAVSHYGFLAREMIAMKSEYIHGGTYRWSLDEFGFETMLGGTPLCEAATNGHENAVRLLLSKGAYTNIMSGYSGSALQGAAKNGHAAIVQVLLDHGADVDSRDGGSLTRVARTALHEACEHGHEEAALALLRAGANVNAESHDMGVSNTPICLATRAGHEGLVRLLLSWGAEVDWSCERTSQTALLIAAQNGHAAIVQLLLSHGADQIPGKVSAEEDDASSPMVRAAEGDHAQVVRMLLESRVYDGLQEKEDHLEQIFRAAIRSGCLKTVKELLSTENDLRTSSWQTLHWAIKGLDATIDTGESGQDVSNPAKVEAIRERYEAIVQLLLQSGADVSQTDGWDKETPLHVAAKGGHEKMVALLLANGADVNALDRSDQTPLYRAARGASDSVVGLLLRAGALVNVGISPLYGAAMGGGEAAAQILIENGAEISEPSGYRPDALVRGAGNGVESVVRALLDEGDDIETRYKGLTALIEAARSGRDPIVRLLLDRGAQLEAKDGDGRTAALAAVMGGHETTAKLLLEKGANPRWTEKTGRNALSWAAEKGLTGIVRLLLNSGAEPDANSADGLTPLCLAVRQGHLGAVQLLADAGADLDSEGGRDSNPLLLAVKNKHAAVVKELLGRNAKPKAQPLLLTAARNGDYDSVAALLGAGVDAEQASLLTALAHAVAGGHTRIAELLLDRRAVPIPAKSAAQAGILTALKLALRESQPGIARRLLPGLIEINPEETEAAGVLKRAAEKGYVDIVQSLLDLRVDPDAEHESGRTPLSYAAEQGHLSVVKVLLDKGEKTKDPAHVVEMLKHGLQHEDVANLLLEFALEHRVLDACGSWMLHVSSYLNYEGIARRLLAEGVCPNVKVRGDHAINAAARRGNQEMVRILLEGGADVDARDEAYGQSALSSAAEFAYDGMMRILLDHGADVESQDAREASTPLIWAAQKGHVRAARMLVDGGADVNAKNREGLTPLLAAAKNGYGEVARLLLERGAGDGRAALRHAAAKGARTLVRILWESGEGPDKQVVELAISEGHKGVARLMETLSAK